MWRNFHNQDSKLETVKEKNVNFQLYLKKMYSKLQKLTNEKFRKKL